jgi:5-methylcytosine-specific restriction endonuclease McrA
MSASGTCVLSRVSFWLFNMKDLNNPDAWLRATKAEREEYLQAKRKEAREAKARILLERKVALTKTAQKSSQATPAPQHHIKKPKPAAGKAKSKAKKRGGGISVSALAAFCKSHGLPGMKPGQSPYVTACEALALCGLPKPEDVPHKEWAKQNSQKIYAARNVAPPAKKQTSDHNAYLASTEFLSSFEWRRLRMHALKHYGPKCMCCGSTPAQGAVMNVDHVKPRKHFPELALEFTNLQILCHDCNHGKGNWDQTDWRPAA